LNESIPILTFAILAVTAWWSFQGFRNPYFREKYIFNPERILAEKEYFRLLTSGFLHADWTHFLFNAFSLYFFGRSLELFFGIKTLLLVYFGSIIGGGLLSLYLHRHHEYRALGASGGVCGVIFASIFLLPGGSIYIFPLPVPIPTWLYAIGFIVGSFLELRRQASNIGHDAHLGGAVVGLLITTALHPSIVPQQPLLYVTVLGLSTGLFLYLWRCPLGFPTTNPLDRWRRFISKKRSQMDRARSLSDDQEMDRLLEKVSRSGLHGLSPSERQRLEEIARKKRR
jgi:membrane associated rhomboid family serine protease